MNVNNSVVCDEIKELSTNKENKELLRLIYENTMIYDAVSYIK